VAVAVAAVASVGPTLEALAVEVEQAARLVELGIPLAFLPAKEITEAHRLLSLVVVVVELTP
jgi:hypothetical protein